tara:strand:+ start:2106 stop:2702 length:597 start_codon:yes stop_codon:yes gene_type:complete
MHWINFIIITLLVHPSWTLSNNFNHLNLKTYKSNKIPYKDLTLISPLEAYTISQNWLENTVFNHFNHNLEKTFPFTYDNIFNDFIKLENYIKTHQRTNDIYMYWMPKSNNKYIKSSPLFIIVCEVNSSNTMLLIKQIIQSPFWDNKQISSDNLKISLTSYASQVESKDIDLTYLYKHDLKYKLSWATWNLTLNSKNNN